jgi:hypothetical protein
VSRVRTSGDQLAGVDASERAGAAAGLAAFTAAARRALAEAELVHLDETGLRVTGRLHILHVASSTRVTALSCHRKRDTEGIDAAGVLPGITTRSPPTPAIRRPARVMQGASAPASSSRWSTPAPPNLLAGADTPRGWCWAQQAIDALLALKAITDTGVLPDPDILAGHRRLIVSAALIGASA